MPALVHWIDSAARLKRGPQRRTSWRAASLPAHQRGVAALIVVSMLLVGMALIALFANKNLIFEQRTSANEYRAARAFELAEAGLQWATARLNDPVAMARAPSCNVTEAGGTQSFADRYLPIRGVGFEVNVEARSGCALSSNGASLCLCPTTAAPSFPAVGDARFTVQFRSVNGDPWAVEVMANGCTSESPECDPGSVVRAEGIASVRAVLRMKPTFAHAPGAAVVAGTSVAGNGGLRIVNADDASNGVTINAGSSVELQPPVVLVTRPGMPTFNSVVDRDESLAQLSLNDALFVAYFGETMAQYVDGNNTWVVGSAACGSRMHCSRCSTPDACGAAVLAAHRDHGVQKFWLAADALFSGTLGGAERPIVVATTANIAFGAGATAFGFFYSHGPEWNVSTDGTVRVFGALASRGSFSQNGTGTFDVIYEPRMFRSHCPNPVHPCAPRGVMVRVPGSWLDRSGGS